jgi:MFS family permease
VVLSGVVIAMHVGKMPPAIPVLQQALGVTLVQAGFLLSAVQLAGMCLGVLAGMSADRLGLRRSLLTGQAILATASLCGMVVSSPSGLLLLRALEGLGFLLAALPAPSLIRQLVRPSQLPLYLGLWSTYMGTGIALALLAGPLAMQALGWQGWWGLLGLLSAAMALCIVWVIPSDQTRASTAAASAPPPAADPPAAWWAPLALTLRHRGPWQVALLFALYSSQWLAVIGFLPAIYAQAGLGASQAGALTALASWINVVGNIAAGRLLQQGWCARYLLWIGYSSMGLGAVLVFGAWTQELPMLRYLAVLGFSAVGGLIPGVLFSLAVRVAPSERTVSSTVGWMQQCSSAGQFFGPPLIAWIAGNVGGWHWTWALTGSAACLGLWLARRVRFQAA